MNFIYLLPLIISVLTQQVVFNEETPSDQPCQDLSQCLKCSFKELRSIDSCRQSGYFKTRSCEINTSPNTTQTITSLSTCSPSQVPMISSFNLAMLFSFLSLITSSILFQKRKSFKSQEQELNLSNIIKA